MNTKTNDFLEYLMVIGSVFGTEGDAVSNSLRPLNFRGRCAFGMPCDHRRISYGCEKKIGVCWSECVGTLDKTFGTGHFQYEGESYSVWVWLNRNEIDFMLVLGQTWVRFGSDLCRI